MYDISNKDKRAWTLTANKVNTHVSNGRFKIIASVHASKSVCYAVNQYPARRCGSTLHELYLGIGVHAELAALIKYDCSGAVMYIAGLNKNDHPICTKPCARCNNLLMNSSLKYIVYMNTEHELVKIKPSDLMLMEVPPFKPRGKG